MEPEYYSKLLVVGVVALVVGIIGGFVLRGAPESETYHTMPDGTLMSDTMAGMTAGLTGKTGDSFDKVFLEEMIVHHEGAVEMARMAIQSSGHAQIKQLAEAIVEAQTKEIDMMRGWQNTWFK